MKLLETRSKIMPVYLVAVSDFYDKTNVNMVTWAENEVNALVLVAARKNKNIKTLEKKLLCRYLTVKELQKYFSDYWNMGLSDPIDYIEAG